MKRSLFLFVLLLLCGSPLFSQKSTRYAVYFETDRHELNEKARQTLDQILQELQYPEDYSVDIFAHTDSRGSEDYNLKLAGRRSQSVTAYLAERGLKTEKTTAASLGENDPAYTNDDESGRKLNRRVDLVVNIATLQSLSELMDRLNDNPMQYFTIHPYKSAHLIGNQGTELWIKAGSFEFSDGSGVPFGPIEVALRETYRMSDMILADLTTTSGSKLLETAGMFYLNASSDGKPLQLKADAQITTAMPAESLRPGMQLFLGEQNAAGRLVNWQATGQGFQTNLANSLPPGIKPLKLTPKPGLISPKKYKLPKYVPEYSKEGYAPVKPREPHKPVVPKREVVIYKPGPMSRLMMGKEKIRQKEDKMYEKQMAVYARALKQYEEKTYPEYLAALESYEAKKATPVDTARVNAWRKEQKAKEQAFYNSRDYLAIAEKYEAEWKEQEEVWAKKMKAWEAENQARIDAYEAQWPVIRSNQPSQGNVARRAYQADLAYEANQVAILRAKKQAAFEARKPNARINSDELNAYIYQVNRLGWVNCDVFSNVKGERMQLAIRDDDKFEEQVYVILKDRNSMLNTGKSPTNSNLYVTAGIPVSTPIRIVAIKVENGHPMMALHETRVGEQAEYQLDYKRCSPIQIRQALQDMNG